MWLKGNAGSKINLFWSKSFTIYTAHHIFSHFIFLSSLTGGNCEVNMTKKYDAITCPEDLCQAPSVCVPLIKGGFRCDGCPDDGNYDEFCRLKTRSFKKGSYMTFPSLKTRNGFTIKLRWDHLFCDMCDYFCFFSFSFVNFCLFVVLFGIAVYEKS